MARSRKTLINIGIALAMGVLLPVIDHYRLRTAAEACLEGLKARGEPMDLAQVLPPPISPEKNALPLVTNAFSQIYSDQIYTNSIISKNAPYTMNRAIPGKMMEGWRQPVIHDPGGTWPPNLTNTWDELGEQLAERQNNLNDFQKLINNPTLGFDYDFSNPKKYVPKLAFILPRIKLAAQWLAASEVYNLRQGKTAEACTDVRAMLALVKSQTQEPFEITHLVRFAIADGFCAGATWDILQATNTSDDNLAQLQGDWESLKFITPFEKAFLFERVSDLRLQQELRHSPTDLAAEVSRTHGAVMHANETYVLGDATPFFERVKNGISSKWDEFQWRWFWTYTDEIRGLQMWQALIDGMQNLDTNHSFQLVQSFVMTNFDKLDLNSVKNNPYAFISQNAYSQLNAMRKAACAETVRNAVITAVALKRYELRHQHLPDSLSELTPDLLKSVPIDYMDGHPLRYRRNTDGTFLLYSVGDNGKDDGGNSSLEEGFHSSNYNWLSSHTLDWVWPQPATPAETQYFYEHPPK